MIGPALRAEIEHTFQIATTRCTTDEVVFVCPECGDTTGNRSVNLRTGVTFCWRCNKGKHGKGNFVAWARANGFEFSSAGDMTGVPLDEVLVEPESAKTRVPYVVEVDLPKGFIYCREEPDSAYATLIGRMAKRKNLTFEDMLEADTGFTRDDPLWEPFCIFPVRELGRTVYYQGRTYVDVPGQTTKKFPSRNEVPHGSSCWLYNYDEFRDRQVPTVIAVEAILSTLSLRKKLRELNIRNVVPLCVFKHSIGSIQLTKLLQCKWLKEICLMFDHDAIDQTWRQMGNLGSQVKLTIAELPSTADNKKLDPNDDPDAAMAAFGVRTPYTMGTKTGSEFERTNRITSRMASIDVRQHCIQPNPRSSRT